MGREKPLNTGCNQVNINIPMGLVNVGIKMGAWFAPDIEGERLEGILDAVRSSQLGTGVCLVLVYGKRRPFPGAWRPNLVFHQK